MHRWLCLWAVVGSSAVHASWPTDVQGSCSGTLTETWGDSITLSCTGDLALSGLTPQARLEAVDSITLSADGSLTIDNLTLRALNISLWGGSSVTLHQSIHLDVSGATRVTQRPPTSPRADLQWGELDIQRGAVISVSQPQTADVQRFTGGALTLGSAGIVSLNNTTGFVLAVAPALTVPEPTTWALMLAGALVVAGCRRR